MINIAIVGAGAIGKRHAKWAAKYANLIAVADIKRDKALSLANEYKCNAYSSLNSLTNMLNGENKIDLVAICTPNGLHAEHTITALKHGCNVLCEKPMALTTEDCEKMIHAAETMNKRLFIVKQNRFNDSVLLIKKLLDENKLGKILSVQLTCAWNRNKEYYNKSVWHGTYMDGGILFTQFSHFIDLIYYLVGDIEIVQAMSNNFIHKGIIDFPDTFVTSFKFKSGVLGTGHFTINSYGKNMEGSLTIFGEKGTIKIGGQYLNKLEYQNIEGDNYYIIANKTEQNNYGSYKGSSSRHDMVYKNVVATLEGKGGIMTTCMDGLKTVQIIEKILEASK